MTTNKIKIMDYQSACRIIQYGYNIDMVVTEFVQRVSQHFDHILVDDCW